MTWATNAPELSLRSTSHHQSTPSHLTRSLDAVLSVVCEYCGREIPSGAALTAHSAKCKSKMEKRQVRSAADATRAEMLTDSCDEKWLDSIFNVSERVGGGLLNRLQRALASEEGQCMKPESAIRFGLLEKVLSTLDRPTEKRDTDDGSSKGVVSGGRCGSGDGTGCVHNA